MLSCYPSCEWQNWIQVLKCFINVNKALLFNNIEPVFVKKSLLSIRYKCYTTSIWCSCLGYLMHFIDAYLALY